MTGFRPDQIQIHLKDHELIVQVNITRNIFHFILLLILG